MKDIKQKKKCINKNNSIIKIKQKKKTRHKAPRGETRGIFSTLSDHGPSALGMEIAHPCGSLEMLFHSV